MTCAISIDQSVCVQCRACVKDCPRGIFYFNPENKTSVHEEIASECITCGHCIAVCPTDAIRIETLDINQFKPASQKLIDYEAFLTLQSNRRSIRQFKPELVDETTIRKIIEATRFSPTAKNTQCLSWLIVNGRDKVKQIAKEVANTFSKIPAMSELVKSIETGEDQATRNASQLAIVYGPKNYTWGTMDASLATASFDLAAATLGIGACWGGFVTTAANKNPEISRILELTADDKVFAAMMFGYPNVQYKFVPQRHPAKLKFI